MTEDTNDKIPADHEKQHPVSLESHLSKILPDKEIGRFREQLPAGFLSDAMEGLDGVKDSKKLETVLHRLNQQMYQQLKHKKSNKKNNAARDMGWIFWTILIILLLIIVSFIVIRFLLHP